MEKEGINFLDIEQKWQKEWEKSKCFQASEKGKKFYCLEMFPYPSASGLHMGHALNYTIGDIFARFKRMNGYNVLYPMGYDAFGLPAENAAIQAKTHPKKYTENSMANFEKQQKAIGLSYDWSRMIKTCSPEYYKWNQYFFNKFYEKGLVYRKKSSVNWCSKCQTVLANEQVHNGKCWRHGDTEVEIKQLEQWFIKTTKYADELLETKNLQWPERIKVLQKNWIGKSHGTEIEFEINGKKWHIFTTRPDTIYGVTFMVISSQHPQLMKLVTEKQKKEVDKFLKKIKSTSEKDMKEMEKEGVFTGTYAINPLTEEKVPVYAGNFVVADYGSGMVMAVPAHDQRDFEFAKKYKIPIKEVIKGGNTKKSDIKERAFTDNGILINSKEFNGLDNEKAKENITDYLIKQKLGKKTINYKFRDWLVSRQRYWGTPIPMICCEKCGIVPVPEKDLPVILPDKVKFGEGNPLETNKDFVNVKCPKCKGKAKRETDTMDTFFDSSWYYLRYTDSKNSKEAFDKKKAEYWMPIDQYIGGAEHACMHLIYARFFTKALRDLGFVKFGEPFTKLFNQGMLHGTDGEKMSKSRGNVIVPEEVSKKYGMDTVRLFLTSQASPDKDTQWSENGIEGSMKIVKRIMHHFNDLKLGKSSAKIESKTNKSIKEISEDIENFRYNMAIIKLRTLFEAIEADKISKKDAESFLKLFHPFCPHITEELWHNLGNKSFISLEKWPICDEKKINKKLEDEENLVEQTKNDVLNILKILNARNQKYAIIKLVAIPNEVKLYEQNKEYYEKSFNASVEVYDIKNFKGDKKAKPGKPAIYVE